MITEYIIPPITTRKQPRPIVHTSPAFVCGFCGHTIRFGDWDYDYLENRYQEGCTCGGRYEFRSIKELYERDGVHFCARLQRYWRTAECPTSTCWAERCVISESRTEEVGQCQ